MMYVEGTPTEMEPLPFFALPMPSSEIAGVIADSEEAQG